MAAILSEVVAVANAQGIALDYDERWAAITGLLEKAIGGKASMLQDVEAEAPDRDRGDQRRHRRGRQARRRATPHNQTMVWMVQAAEQHYLKAKAN